MRPGMLLKLQHPRRSQVAPNFFLKKGYRRPLAQDNGMADYTTTHLRPQLQKTARALNCPPASHEMTTHRRIPQAWAASVPAPSRATRHGHTVRRMWTRPGVSPIIGIDFDGAQNLGLATHASVGRHRMFSPPLLFGGGQWG